MKKCIFKIKCYCTVLSDAEVKVPCVEGPCPHESFEDIQNDSKTE